MKELWRRTFLHKNIFNPRYVFHEIICQTIFNILSLLLHQIVIQSYFQSFLIHLSILFIHFHILSIFSGYFHEFWWERGIFVVRIFVNCCDRKIKKSVMDSRYIFTRHLPLHFRKARFNLVNPRFIDGYEASRDWVNRITTCDASLHKLNV